MSLHGLYLLAIVAEAMSGALMGMRRGMDLFGICLVGTVAALGGGTVRDVLLGHYPLGWIAHPEYLLLTAGAAALTALAARRLHKLRMPFLVVDALGLVAFTVLGCDIAASQGLPTSIVLVSGLITGIFGGLLRDVLCNEIPLVLQRELYASVSLLCGALYLGLPLLGVGATATLVAAFVAGLALRLCALRFDWQLPRFGDETIRGFD